MCSFWMALYIKYTKKLMSNQFIGISEKADQSAHLICVSFIFLDAHWIDDKHAVAWKWILNLQIKYVNPICPSKVSNFNLI